MERAPIQTESTVPTPVSGAAPSLPFQHYLPRPGDPDWNELHTRAKALAAEILPRIKVDGPAWKEKAIRTRRKAQAYRQTVENYLINRKRFAVGNHALRPIYFIWTMLNKCNYRCTYCDDHMGRMYPDLPEPGKLDTAQGKRLLEIMRTGTTAVYFCGGEPTMRDDLPEMARHARGLGYFPLMINTNGSLFHTRLLKPEWSDWLYNMDIVIVSLDGLNVDGLNKLWVTKSSEKVLQNILVLRELQQHVRFKLVVNTVFHPDRLDEARAVMNWANDLGIWFVPVPVNEGSQTDTRLYEMEKYQALVKTVMERKTAGYPLIGSERLLGRLMTHDDYMCLTTLKPHVDMDGRAIWPCKATTNVPPVKLNILDYDSVDAAWEAGSRLLSPHFFHGPACNQCGGDCGWMQNYTTAVYHDGLTNLLTSGFLGELREFSNCV